jgi:hypothetical protein
MDLGFNDVFSPIELLEPIAISSEFQTVLGITVKCDKGYVCGGGQAEL